MELQEADIDFLARGQFGLRYLSGRPDLVAAHKKPEGVDGDCYCLSGLGPLLPLEETKKFATPLQAIFQNKARLAGSGTGSLKDAIGKIVVRALHESPDGGRSLTFMLLRDMPGTASPYDVHPLHAPTGKAGRKRIVPGQIAAWIKLDDMDILEGEINQEMDRLPGVKEILINKIADGIAGLRPSAPGAVPSRAPAEPQKA